MRKSTIMSTTPTIEKLAKQSYEHALNVLKSRFPEGESIILQVAGYACLYARYILKAPWPAAESIILTDAHYALHYAVYVLDARWPAAESVINSNPCYAKQYKEFLESLPKCIPIKDEEESFKTITKEEYMQTKTCMKGYAEKIKELEDKLEKISKLVNGN